MEAETEIRRLRTPDVMTCPCEFRYRPEPDRRAREFDWDDALLISDSSVKQDDYSQSAAGISAAK
jgi:hypothetical protein